MATENFSTYDESSIPSAENMRFGIIVSEWHKDITQSLAEAAIACLKKHGADEEDIHVHYVPGSFELPLGGQLIADAYDTDAIILLGCVIRGETPHFDYVCQGVTQGAMKLSLDMNIPCIFGVLTTDTKEQALDRAGGKLGNKGDDSAVAAIKMVALEHALMKDLYGDDTDDDDDDDDENFLTRLLNN